MPKKEKQEKPEKTEKTEKQTRQLPERFYSTPESAAILGTPEGEKKHKAYLEACKRIEEWKKEHLARGDED